MLKKRPILLISLIISFCLIFVNILVDQISKLIETNATSSFFLLEPFWKAISTYGDNYLFYFSVNSQYTPSGSQKSAVIEAKTTNEKGFAILMQTVDAEAYLNQRICLSGYVKTENVDNSAWAGLWMRVDGSQKQVLVFDNMQDRPIKGTKDWHEYKVILNIPKESNKISFGVLLNGSGKVWINDLTIKFVNQNVIPTNKRGDLLSQPLYLDFENQLLEACPHN